MNDFNFTDRTRRALHAARDAAAALRHEYVGTEHILLGLICDPGCVAASVLTHLGVNLDSLKAKIEEIVTTGNTAVPEGAQLPYTSRSKKVVELAMVCARENGDSFIGTQHLLLGLLREEKGIAAQVLAHSGITSRQVTAAINSVAAADERRFENLRPS